VAILTQISKAFETEVSKCLHDQYPTATEHGGAGSAGQSSALAGPGQAILACP
jgi:hypothetical protein